jgi:glycosyltransferase involved in cell wall biosynthesis
MTARVSFIVPVRNDATRLEVCLRSIRANERTPGDIEIVVVDNGSSDDSAEVARRLGAQVIVVENSSVSELRNSGAHRASADVLAFVDADHQIGADWVAVVLDNLREPSVGAVGSFYLSPPDGTWVQRAFGFLRGRSTVRHDISWLSSGNLAVRRNAFEALGGFDTSLHVCEDVDLCHRLGARGLRIVSDPDVENIHHGDPHTLKGLFVAELWRGRDNLRVSFRRPISWRAIPSAIVAIVDAMMLVVILAGAAGAIAGWEYGLRMAGVALAVFFAGVFLKVTKAAHVNKWAATMLVPALIVGTVYDLARALSLIARVPHRNTRARTTVTASS